MKKLSIIGITIFAFTAGTAIAGGSGGCIYGKNSPIVSADANDALENSAGDQTADPKLLLGLLKKKPGAETEKPETITN